MYYLNARMYDPVTARFLQEDTYRGNPNDPLSLNLYSYCHNEPIMYYDPSGHIREWFARQRKTFLHGIDILMDPVKKAEAFELIEKYGDLGPVQKRALAVSTGYAELAIATVETGKAALNSGYVQKPMLEVGRALGLGGLDNDLVYEITRKEVHEKIKRNTETLENIPKAVYDSALENFGHVVNKDNAYNFFFNPEASFTELVDYSRSGISTAMTVYGGAKMFQSGHHLLKSIRFDSAPALVTPFGQVMPSTFSMAIDAGSVGRFFTTGGLVGGINFATSNNVGGSHWSNISSEDLNWTNHGHKHFASKNARWKDVVKSTKNSPAKYKPEINVEQFERMAWDKGVPVANGKTWKVYKADSIIGAKKGIETQYVRIELSSGTIHGHPITPQEFRSLLK